jgi:hypothetical protein
MAAADKGSFVEVGTESMLFATSGDEKGIETTTTAGDGKDMSCRGAV